MHATGTRESTTGGQAPAPAVRRLLAALLAAVQLLLVLSPLLDRDLGESTRVHAEAQGVQLHYAHDAAECGGCAQRHLTATPPAAPAPDAVRATSAGTPTTRAVAAARASLPSARFSRAPPSAV